MNRTIASTLLLLFLAATSHAQITVGDRPSKAEETAAKQTISKLEAKKITLEVGEFEELIPRKGSVSPFLWISSDNSTIIKHEVEKGHSFAIVGKRRGTNGTPYDLHTFTPREYRWAIILVNRQPQQTYDKDGNPIPIKATISVVKNGDNGTPEEADLIEVSVGTPAPAPIPPPVNPDPKPEPKPEPKPDPAKPDAELVAKFKASLAADKTAAATQGYDWSKAAVWAGTYQDTSKLLASGDPALKIKDVADLYEKHKTAWTLNEVPAEPFLQQTRAIIGKMLEAELGKAPNAQVKSLDASKLFGRIGNALTEALKP